MLFASNIQSPEGPVALPDGSLLCVEMAPERGCVSQISPDGQSVRVLAVTGRPNGLAVDRHGIIWVAESKTPALLRMTMDGKVESFLTGCRGVPFIFPNDLAFGPDGLLYLTDSGIYIENLMTDGHIRKDYTRQTYDGRVYQINTRSGEINQFDSGIKFTNGIAFGPDGYVYANETIGGAMYRYAVQGSRMGQREWFGNVNDPAGPPGWRGPDGMKFGADGKLYCTVYMQGDVTVLDRAGNVCKRIKTRGIKPTNLTFALGGEQKIFVTEVEYNAVEEIAVDTEGMVLYG